MGRKCSHCGNIGHNSRTCTSFRATTTTFVGLRLFGVQLDISSSSSCVTIKKSFSMDSFLSPSSPSSSFSNSSKITIDENSDHRISIGYLSDGLIGRAQERKKGVPWTEEEHRTFLIGLEKLGKGDWRGISRKFVTTRTPTQVASHAQKYFLRLATINKKKRRSSLFDMVGSSNTNTTSQAITNSNCKPEDYVFTHQQDDKSELCEVENDTTTLSLLGRLKHLQYKQETPDHNKYSQVQPASAEAGNKSVPIWLHPQMNSSNVAMPGSQNAAAAPDLELTLAAPNAMISVT